MYLMKFKFGLYSFNPSYPISYVDNAVKIADFGYWQYDIEDEESWREADARWQFCDKLKNVLNWEQRPFGLGIVSAEFVN